MAFQNLRTGSTVYIFHKDNSPKLEIGQVIAEPKIRQKYPIPTPGQPYAGFMPQQQEQVDSMLAKYGVTLENNVDYDYVYVANMGKADLLKSSITDEQHLALYVKDVVDDVDAGDGEIMREWDAKMTSRGIAVDWEEIL